MTNLNVVVIVPLVEERDYLYHAIKGRPNWESPKTQRQTMTYHYSDGNRTANVQVRTIEKMGHLEAVLAMNAAASMYTPELVILVGLAGSMDPELVGYGDVVVSNQVKMYAPNKVGTISSNDADNPYYHFAKDTPPSKPAGRVVRIDDRDRLLGSSYHRYRRDIIECTFMNAALTKLEPVLSDKTLKPLNPSMVPEQHRTFKSTTRSRQVQYGWIFGSNCVVDSKEYRDYLNDKNADTISDIYSQMNEREKIVWKEGKLLAIDMESYGVLKAIETLRTTPRVEGGISNLVGGIVVRGISDLAECKGRSDTESDNQLRRLAVSNAAEVTTQIIEKIDYSAIARR